MEHLSVPSDPASITGKHIPLTAAEQVLVPVSPEERSSLGKEVANGKLRTVKRHRAMET